MTEVSEVTDHVEAVALAYCTDQPLRLTVELPALKISMKSLRNRAPEFPPPPKTWLMTIRGEESGDCVGVGVGVGVANAFTSDTGLLCTPSADTTSVDVPAPRNSLGTRT